MIANELMKEMGEWRMVAFGAITVLFLVAFRHGVVGLVNDLWQQGGRQLIGRMNLAIRRPKAK